KPRAAGGPTCRLERPASGHRHHPGRCGSRCDTGGVAGLAPRPHGLHRGTGDDDRHDRAGHGHPARLVAAPAGPADQEPADCRHPVGAAAGRAQERRRGRSRMSLYLALKWLHIVSSVLLVGTGLGSAFYMFFTNRSGNVQAQAVVTRLVVRADWWFTTPTVFIQPATGLAMAHLAGLPLATPW